MYKKLCQPFVQGSELGVLALLEARQRNKPEFSSSPSVVLGFSSTDFPTFADSPVLSPLGISQNKTSKKKKRKKEKEKAA